MSSLQGQTALITGGGSGIGLACAAQLARDGAAVVLAGRSAEKLEAAAAGLRATDAEVHTCLLYTSDAADDPLCVDLGGRRSLKKKTTSVLRKYNLTLSP